MPTEPSMPTTSDRSAAARIALLLLAGVALAALAPRPAAAQGDDLDVPYVPTPRPVVAQMLELVEPAAGDSLYDLGSGDGRIVITAAERYGTPGVGIELDSARVAEARRNAEDAGVDDRVRFVRGDLFEADLRPATVVTLYLLTSVNLELRPKLFRELRPGTRVVSHDFDMGQWSADSVVDMPGHDATVYFWVVPASVAGRWTLQPPSGGEVTLEIRQKFQELRADAPGSRVTVEEAAIEGDRITLALSGVPGAGGDVVELTGTVSGGRMSGATADGTRWSARRVAGAGQPMDQWNPSTSEAGAAPR